MMDLKCPRDVNLLYPGFGKQTSNWHAYLKNRKDHDPNLLGFTIRLGEIDRDIAERAFESVVRRHESLRTVFAQAGGELIQQILPYDKREHGLLYFPCKNQQHFERLLRIQLARTKAVVRNLEKGPLFMGAIFEVQGAGVYFDLAIHHIIADAWSVQVLKNDLLTAYRSIKSGHSSALMPLRMQLKEYAQLYHGSDTEGRARAYWTARLRCLKNESNINALYTTYNLHINAGKFRSVYQPAVALTVGNVMKALRAGYGHTFFVRLNENIVEKIRHLSSRCGTTPSIVLLSSFLMLSRLLYCTTKTLIVSRFNGRLNPLSHQIVGNFTSAIYSYMKTGHPAKPEDVIEMVHHDFRSSMAYAVNNPLILSDIPITVNCHLCVNILDDIPEHNGDADHYADRQLVEDPKPTHFPIENTIFLNERTIHLNWVYNTTLFRGSIIQFIANEHIKILEGMTSAI